MDAWHAKHNGQHGDPQWEGFIERLRPRLDIKFEELLAEHDNAGRFGMSKAGGCTRAVALKYLDKSAGEPFDGSTRMTFFLGHLCEVIALTTMESLGLWVTGAQQPVTIDPFFLSYGDGTTFLPKSPPSNVPIGEYGHWGGGEVLTNVSIKSAGYKKSGREKRGDKWTFVRRGFPELPFEGVRKAQPMYWAQAQAEMHGRILAGDDCRQTLIVFVAKDMIKAMSEDPYLGYGEGGNGSLVFYTELIPYDEQFCTKELVPTWKYQWEYVQEGKPGSPLVINNTENEFRRLTKPAQLGRDNNRDASGTYNPCDYCDFLQACKEAYANSFRRRPMELR